MGLKTYVITLDTGKWSCVAGTEAGARRKALAEHPCSTIVSVKCADTGTVGLAMHIVDFVGKDDFTNATTPELELSEAIEQYFENHPDLLVSLLKQNRSVRPNAAKALAALEKVPVHYFTAEEIKKLRRITVAAENRYLFR